MRRPFRTPLIEVSAEIDLALDGLVDMRAQTFYESVANSFPVVMRLPVILVPPDGAALQNLHQAAYRFYSPDQNQVVQIGPRMLAYNVVAWPGYERFRADVQSVAETYVKIMQVPRIIRHSLGFYNRIPVADFSELRDILSLAAQFGPDATLQDFLCQLTTQVPEGALLAQYRMMAPDDRTAETYLAVNNIVRLDLPETQPLDIDQWLGWLDAAHSRAKDALWEVLTDAARESWKETSDVVTRA